MGVGTVARSGSDEAMITRDERPSPGRWLDRIYLLPNDTRCLEDYQRTRHLDLPELTTHDLDREAFRVMHRLAYEPDRGRRVWLHERREAIRTEQGRRREEARRGAASPRQPATLVWGTPEARHRPAAPKPRTDHRPLVPIRGGGRRGR